MNSGLLLLFVAALYTTGCVNAETITVNDAKKIITAAWNLYVGVNLNVPVHTTTVKLESGTNVVVTCRVSGKRLECPSWPQGDYLLPESMADEVGNWFITNIAPSGQYREPQDKPYGGRYANLYKVDSAPKKIFNYHLEVDKWSKENKEFKLLRMLLSRMLQ